MKHILILIICHFTFMLSGQSILGDWASYDDKTDLKRSHISIEGSDKMTGTITELFNTTNGEENPLCIECKGDLHNQPIKGLSILQVSKWDEKKKEGKGKIMDPENGKTYKCNLAIEKDGRLKVRGYIGFSALGRTQYWKRAE